MRGILYILPFLMLLASCKNAPSTAAHTLLTSSDSMLAAADSPLIARDTPPPATPPLRPTAQVSLKGADREAIADFAETLIGVPYVYASTDPKRGFDCSGFITYVFNHFKVPVPRSSIDFTSVGTEVPVNAARRGDIILFTGTDSSDRSVGHMGLVVSPAGSDTLRFIHSTSGKAKGVTITPLNGYYEGRFVKTIRLED